MLSVRLSPGPFFLTLKVSIVCRSIDANLLYSAYYRLVWELIRPLPVRRYLRF